MTTASPLSRIGTTINCVMARPCPARELRARRICAAGSEVIAHEDGACVDHRLVGARPAAGGPAGGTQAVAPGCARPPHGGRRASARLLAPFQELGGRPPPEPVQRGDMRRPADTRTTGPQGGRGPRGRDVMRWLMASFYLLAGIAHLTLTDKFLLIVPDWVPFPRAVVLVTGVCEIAGSIALLSMRLRRLAGITLALYAIS